MKSLKVLLLVLALAHCLLLCSQRLLPFVDLPVHLAAATVYRYFGQESNAFSEFFTLRQGLRPNVFHIKFIGSSLFPSVEVGAKLFYSLYIVLLFLSVYWFIKAVNGEELFALFTFLLVYNVNSAYGFMAMSMSIPGSVLLYLFAVKTFQTDSFGLHFLLGFVLCLFFFLHVITTGFLLQVIGLHLLLVYRKSIKSLLCRCLVLLPATFTICYWYFNKTFQYKVQANHSTRGMWRGSMFSDICSRLYRWPFVDSLEVVSLPITLLLLLLIIAALLVHLRSRRGKELMDWTSGGLTTLWPFLVSAFFWHFLLPHKISGEVWISARFSSFFLLSLLVLLSRLEMVAPKRCTVFALILFFIHLYAVHSYFVTFDKACTGFDKELLPSGGKERIAGLIVDETVRIYPVFVHFADYYTVWKQGVGASFILDGAEGTAQRKVDESVIPKQWRQDEEPLWDVPEEAVDALLVRGDLSKEQLAELHAYEQTKSSGKWALWQKRKAE